MSRTLTAAERAAVSAIRSAHFSKFEIQDADGTYRDYTQYLRTDWFTGASIEESIDTNTMQLNATLLRQTGTLSLSPFIAASLVNRNAGGSYATAIDAWRKWKLSVAVMPAGYSPNGTDWKEMCQGRIDRIDWAGDQIIVTGRGEEAVLIDFFISTERQYGSVGGIAMETTIQSLWDNNLGSAAYTLSTPVSPSYLMNPWTQQKGNLFPATADVASRVGGVVRFRYDSSNTFKPTLLIPNRAATPGAEVWTVGANEITRYNKAAIDKQGIRNFIKIRFVDATLGTQTVISPWMPGTGTVSCAAGVATFSSSQAGIIRTTGTNTEIIVGGVAYTVTAFNGTTSATLLSQLATGGVPTFGASAFTLSDTLSGAGSTSSITAFGRNDLEIDLAFTSQVNTAAKAQGMADAVRSDTELSDLDHEFEMLGAWFVQLHDYGKFEANGVHFDSPQYGGVTRIRHDIANGTIKSTIGVRGKPAGKYASWRYIAGAQVASPTQPIQVRARIVSQTPTTAVVRVAVADPYPQSINSATITYTELGTGAATSPASGQVVTMGTTITEAAGTYADFTVTRPTSSSDAARVTFTASAAGRASATDAVDVPMSFAGQGSIVPTPVDKSLFTYNAGGATSGQMWLSWTWPAFSIPLPDGSTISVPASSSLATPPSPTLSQVVSGALAGRTRFVRIGYVKNQMIMRVGAEASLAISANNLLKVTSPGSVTGYDGWVPLVGSATNTEFTQSSAPPSGPVAFGTDWTEPVGGADISGQTPYDNARWPSAATAFGLNAASTFFFYLWWDIAASCVAFADRGQIVQIASAAIKQFMDGRIALVASGLTGITPNAGTTGTGNPLAGKNV